VGAKVGQCFSVPYGFAPTLSSRVTSYTTIHTHRQFQAGRRRVPQAEVLAFPAAT
jgi:hypothetical protein